MGVRVLVCASVCVGVYMWSTILSMIKSDDDGDNVCVCWFLYACVAADVRVCVGVCGCVFEHKSQSSLCSRLPIMPTMCVCAPLYTHLFLPAS